jgi:outer membrane protein OmpA-like peptidoglycan-associated protein
MRALKGLAFLSLALALGSSACTREDRLGRAIDSAKFVPKSDAQLQRELGMFPTLGPSHSGFESVPADLGYAVEVIRYEPGVPAPIPEGMAPSEALGRPDYVVDISRRPRCVSLGNGGWMVLRFGGAGLSDVPGPDLFVWEVGPSKEGMTISISDDAEHWTAVGELIGGACSLDIGPFVQAGQSFHYVRIHDIPYQGSESDMWPGADIDAVGVRAADVSRVVLPSEVLFAFDSADLGEGAAEALSKVVADVKSTPGTRVSVEGHTDDVGARDYNQSLSERRAASVKSYLVSQGIDALKIESSGLGATRPVASNDTEEGRKKNRRVEVVISRAHAP